MFSGITFRRWLRVLRENQLDIDLPYWRRVPVTTLLSIYNSVLARIDSGLYGRAIRNADVLPPIFILGVFRSGTSYLHNLFAQDSRFAFPNFYQVAFPHSFLCSESLSTRLFNLFVPRRRPQDQSQLGLSLPNEDEIALCNILGRSNNLDLVFGRQFRANRRYFTLRDLSDSEREQWKAALKWFVKKLTVKHKRPLVLKSPGHTCRISTLLEAFPSARFVHIHRNPYDVFQSWNKMVRNLSPWWRFQRANYDVLEDDILSLYAMIYDAFLEERALIPSGHFYELGYEDLVRNPVGHMRGVYQALGLPEFAEVEPKMVDYIESIAGYQRSEYPDLSPRLRARSAQEWQRFFVAWGYPT